MRIYKRHWKDKDDNPRVSGEWWYDFYYQGERIRKKGTPNKKQTEKLAWDHLSSLKIKEVSLHFPEIEGVENNFPIIYFVQQGITGPIKIGFTENDINIRIQRLQTANPYPLKIVGLITGDKALEAKLHVQFSPYRLNGEWFKPCKEIFNFLYPE